MELALASYPVFKTRAEVDEVIKTIAGTPFEDLAAHPIVMSKADAKKLDDLATARQKEFHAFRYPDYIRDVSATEEVFKRYSVNPSRPDGK